MIVSFSVSNFRSFSSEETLSLVESPRFADRHPDHAVVVPDANAKVLRAAVLYGPNGAGKSNLFKALQYLRLIALQPRKKDQGTGRERFRFAGEADLPSTFDLQFIVADKLYRFGFTADDHRITEEWLVRVIGDVEEPLYERVSNGGGKVTIDVQGLRTVGPRLTALATVGGPQNQSFLATIDATLDTEDHGDELRAILDWFKNGLTLVGPDRPFVGLGTKLNDDVDFLAFAGDYLKSSSTGVDHLTVTKTEISEEELRALLPEGVLATLDDDAPSWIRLREGHELLIERTGDPRYFRITVQAAHEHQPGSVIALELVDESDGTRRLLNLIPALHHLHTSNAVYFIDEIDRSLHPILVLNFLASFLGTSAGGRGQIIVTTHEANLLDLELLRRDEIWFAEKGPDGGTRLYSLADFKVRNDFELRKHYLQGRFGAVPFLGSLDHLLADQRLPE